MARMVGADVEALERLAYQFDQAADRLLAQTGQVGNGIQIGAWVGPVATRFRIEWDSTHSVSLRSAAEALKSNAAVLRKNAADQARASSGDTAGGLSGFSSGDGATAIEGRKFEDLSPQDFADFAEGAYTGKGFPPGWTELTGDELRLLGINPADLHTKNGLDARIVTDGSGNYVLTFAGTDPKTVDLQEDAAAFLNSGTATAVGQAISDLRLLMNSGSSTEEAVNLAIALDGAYGVKNLAITGHSLGGRHAAAAGIVTGAQTMTFNAAGLTTHDLDFVRIVMGHELSIGDHLWGKATSGSSHKQALDMSHITNFYTKNDPLSTAKYFTTAAEAVGIQVKVDSPVEGMSAHDVSAFKGYL